MKEQRYTVTIDDLTIHDVLSLDWALQHNITLPRGHYAKTTKRLAKKVCRIADKIWAEWNSEHVQKHPEEKTQ